MIVSVLQAKQLLGIEPDDATEDAHLERLIVAATVFVEKETHTRFSTPIPKTEYQRGSGQLELYIRGHIDDAPSESESADPLTPLTVQARIVGAIGEDWITLTEGIDYERRGDTLIGAAGYGWSRMSEFKLDYEDGYRVAPDDIQELVLEMVQRQYNNDISISEGTAGVTSESLGDYSYSVDLGATAILSGSVITDTGWLTINHYRRILV
jgi:Phage QLRG family, putative DNA packaging.